MKREIKFRGKHLHRHEWIYGGIGKDWNNNVFILPNENWSKGGIVEKDTIGQFTGLHDKNGTDIYEGDIVRNESCKGVVSYRNGAFVLDLGNSCGCVYLLYLDSLLVVGNIYDNPDLLKKSQNFSPTCATCNSYNDGKCTNFGKEVKAEDSCKYYQSDVIEYTCQQCGRKYEIIDSDAGDREKFCCKACENGY